MRKLLLLSAIVLFAAALYGQSKVSWVSTSPNESWKLHSDFLTGSVDGKPDVEILVTHGLQTVQGFGTCFNELGWTSLSVLNNKDRQSILRELFAPGVGANFTICRMPVGGNDFSRKWYSYDETEGDFGMKHFSISNDRETLIPFIKNALEYNPGLKIWASPWSPPAWMKYNKHYAAKSVLGNVNFKSDEFGMDLKGINNGLPPEKEGKEGTNMFIQDDRYFKAYVLYSTTYLTLLGDP